MNKREIQFMDHYTNSDGFHEWTTLDEAGNLIRCYSNGDAELHIKEPWCYKDNIKMRKIRNQDKWRCPCCGVEYDISDIGFSVKYPDPDDYDPRNDYGQYMYPEAEHFAGPPDTYEAFPYGLLAE